MAMVGTGMKARTQQDIVPKAKVHPRVIAGNAKHYVHHFDAIHELTDNSIIRPLCTRVEIQWREKSTMAFKSPFAAEVAESPLASVLICQDDGDGMSRLLLHRYLSFGYSASEGDEEDVGRHGVGGKAGMMKLGQDALVFTNKDGQHTIGLLSVTMHELEQLDEIVIPMVEFKLEKGKMKPADKQRDAFSLKAIEQYAAQCFGLNSWGDILKEFNDMYNLDHGTKLMVALSPESKSIIRLNRPAHDIEVFNVDQGEHYSYQTSLRSKMQIMYQEESPGSCPDLFIDGEKVELLGRQDVFEELDQKRLYPADGSLAKLKLPGEVFSDEGDAPEIEYQICYIDEACGQKVTQAGPENIHYGHDIFCKHGSQVWRLIQVGNGCKDWDNDTKHDQHIPRRERLGYGVRLVSYCTLPKELMETRPTKDGFNVTKDAYKQYKTKFKKVIKTYTDKFATRDPNKKKRVTELDHLGASGSTGDKSNLNASGGRRPRVPAKTLLANDDDDDFAPEDDQAKPSNGKKVSYSLPKRIKIQLLHNRAVELARHCSTAENKEKKDELVKELWQVQQFCDEVDGNAEWPAEVTERVGPELAAYGEKLSEHEFVTDELGLGWEHVDNMVGTLVWARIGTGVNSLDSWWWAARVVGRSPSEKHAKPNQRKVQFFGENSASYVAATTKYILPFTAEPPKRDCKNRLPRHQQEEYELGMTLAILEMEGPQVGNHILVRFVDQEAGTDGWYRAEVKQVTPNPDGIQKTLFVQYDDGDEENVQYPDPDVQLQVPLKVKVKRQREEKEPVVRQRPALEVMYAGVERGGEARLRSFLTDHGLTTQVDILVAKGLDELEDLLEKFGCGYDPRSENKAGPFLQQLCDAGLNESDGRKVVEALRVENQTRLRKAMAGLTAGA